MNQTAVSSHLGACGCQGDACQNGPGVFHPLGHFTSLFLYWK